MFAQLVSTYHLHHIVDHFTIALLTFGIAAEILAAAAVLLFRNSARVSVWSNKLRSTSLLLMIGGAAASVLSYFTGDAEADRLWDTMRKGSDAWRQGAFLTRAVEETVRIRGHVDVILSSCASKAATKWRLKSSQAMVY